LDHLTTLGVDAMWLSPIYCSAVADAGYDISDHTDINPIFGNLDRFDALLTEAHHRGLYVLMDFVPNHTSDRDPWFVESRSSRSNAKRDWYIWRDEPNLARIAGSRKRLDMGRQDQSVLFASLLARAARPELAQPRSRASRCRILTTSLTVMRSCGDCAEWY
jgi:glycosidase